MKADFYLHSRCCIAHWELAQYSDRLVLECEKCGRHGLTIAKVYNHNDEIVDPPLAVCDS